MSRTVSQPPRTLRNCTVEGCDVSVWAREMCRKHYQRWLTHGDPEKCLKEKGERGTLCECGVEAFSRGMCRRHYFQWWKSTRPACSVDGCETLARTKGLCARHYQRLKKYGSPTGGPAFRRRRGEGLPRWAYWQRHDEQRLAADPALITYVEILRSDPCSYCDGACEHIDHIVPVDAGGILQVENVTASCGRCNVSKNMTPLLVFMATRTDHAV